MRALSIAMMAKALLAMSFGALLLAVVDALREYVWCTEQALRLLL